MTREGAPDRELPGRTGRILTEPAPEDAEPHSVKRLLELARHLAPIVTEAGTDDESRADRGGACRSVSRHVFAASTALCARR